MAVIGSAHTGIRPGHADFPDRRCGQKLVRCGCFKLTFVPDALKTCLQWLEERGNFQKEFGENSANGLIEPCLIIY